MPLVDKAMPCVTKSLGNCLIIITTKVSPKGWKEAEKTLNTQKVYCDSIHLQFIIPKEN